MSLLLRVLQLVGAQALLHLDLLQAKWQLAVKQQKTKSRL
jgi:hypothetical protein